MLEKENPEKNPQKNGKPIYQKNHQNLKTEKPERPLLCLLNKQKGSNILILTSYNWNVFNILAKNE